MKNDIADALAWDLMVISSTVNSFIVLFSASLYNVAYLMHEVNYNGRIRHMWAGVILWYSIRKTYVMLRATC